MATAGVTPACDFLDLWGKLHHICLYTRLRSNIHVDDPERVTLLDLFGISNTFSFPDTSGVLHRTMLNLLKERAQYSISARPNDLLWLFGQFFQDTFTNGVEMDLISHSEDSIFSISIAPIQFAHKPKQKRRPDNLTLLAITHLSEQGLAGC